MPPTIDLRISDAVLVESKSIRDDQVASLSDDGVAEIMARVKGILHYARVGSNQLATSEQIASFYGVPEDTVKSAYKNNRSEFEADGVKPFKGKDLRLAKSVIDLANKARQVLLWTPRGAFRLGLLLTGSPVAKALRDELVNAHTSLSTDSTAIAIPTDPDQDPILANLAQIAQVRRAQLEQERTLQRHDDELAELRAKQQRC